MLTGYLTVHLDPIVPVLSGAVLRSAWVELDSNVRAAMWQPLLVFLKGAKYSVFLAYMDWLTEPRPSKCVDP